MFAVLNKNTDNLQQSYFNTVIKKTNELRDDVTQQSITLAVYLAMNSLLLQFAFAIIVNIDYLRDVCIKRKYS